MKKILLLFLFFPFISFSQEWTQVGADIDGKQLQEYSGRSVSISSNGNRVAIGAPLHNIENADEGNIVTIEGLSNDNSHPIQKAWVKHEVSQCGYCQPGQMMTAAALLERNPNPDDEDIDNAMKMNLCRCGTYDRIRKAIHSAGKNK